MADKVTRADLIQMAKDRVADAEAIDGDGYALSHELRLESAIDALGYLIEAVELSEINVGRELMARLGIPYEYKPPAV